QGAIQFINTTNEPLVREEANGSLSPGLALKWGYLRAAQGSGHQNEDFVVTLRHQARYSDGTPVTAGSVVTWVHYLLKLGAIPLGGVNPKVTAAGKWTVRFHLSKPNPTMPLTMVSITPASPKFVAHPALFNRQGTGGAGPYMVDMSKTVLNNIVT